MRKHIVGTPVIILAIALLAPGVMAQMSPADVAQSYYAALGQAAASGDMTALLDLFADDATVTVPALSPEPVRGREAIQTTISGILAMLQGLEVTVGDIAVEGEQVTVNYTLTVASMETPAPASDTFVIQGGKIQSLTIDLAPEAVASSAGPNALPQTGAPGVPVLPALLMLGGAVFVGLSRRFSP